MRVRILGSAAGGGFPQWNCNCANCCGIRSGSLSAKPRTQCTVAVSAEGERWALLNAGPDLRTQIVLFPELCPKGTARGSPIVAVLLNDAELDHITGLLSLRESQGLELHCTEQVFGWAFRSNPVFAALIRSDRFHHIEVKNRKLSPLNSVSGDRFWYEAIYVDGKVPTYVKNPGERFDGSNVGYKIVDRITGSSIIHVPAIRSISEELTDAIGECSCLLFDGSFWSDDELAQCGVGNRTALAMGHIPISGPEGSLARLSHLPLQKIYTHVNNTNPILDEGSPERRAIEESGWQVAEDGMDFTV